MLRVIDSLASLYKDWSQLRAQGSVKNSSVALSDFCVSVCAESCDWLSPGLLGAAQQVWADMCQGGCFPAVQQGRRRRTSGRRHARIRNQRIQTTHSGAQVLGGPFSQPQSCCKLQASAMSKQPPVACIPKSSKTTCSLVLLICPSILLVHIGISV